MGGDVCVCVYVCFCVCVWREAAGGEPKVQCYVANVDSFIVTDDVHLTNTPSPSRVCHVR